jgi:D-alanyl-D-alanine carboxypeptidase
LRTTLAGLVAVCAIAACGDGGGSEIAAGGVDPPAELTAELGEIRELQGAPWGVTVPGLAATVTAGDGDELGSTTAVSGEADPPGTTPLSQDDRFHVGSVTKTFTAALIMQLDQDGLLSLDDSISNWVDLPDGDAITVEMLLGHTSGLPEYYELPGGSDETTPEQAIALVADAPLLATPGSAFSYANTNYLLLGSIAERVTDSTWEQEIRNRFIEPFGLADTYVWTGEAQGPTITGARSECDYEGEPSCEPPRPLPLAPVVDSTFWANSWAAGALVSTPADLARWMRALVMGEVVDRDHVDLMTTPSPESIESFAELPLAGPLRLVGMGQGLATYEIDGLGTGFGHNGQVPGFVSNVAHLPDASLTVAVAANFEQADNLELLGQVAVAATTADS